jgi:site-specific DNA-cytosine methylase
VSQQSISKVQGSTVLTSKLLIFDLFAGTGSATQAFEDAGHTVIKFDIDKRFDAERVDLLNTTAQELIDQYGQPDFVWASPPCTTFSVASMGFHWLSGGDNPIPKTEAAKHGIKLAEQAIQLVKDLNPQYGFVIENPRGMMRKMPFMQSMRRQTITYCQYGLDRQKPTDLWSNLNWNVRPMCKKGSPCHIAAPSGSTTGTQGLAKWKAGVVPYELSQEICDVIHNKQMSELG